MSRKFDEEGDVHPEEKSCLGFEVLLRWVNPLIQLSNERPLVDNDVWNPPRKDQVSHIAQKFWEEWEKEKDLYEASRTDNAEAEQQHGNKSKNSRTPSLLRALMRTFGWRMFLGGIAQMCFFLFQIGQPFLVGQLVSYIQTGEGGIRVGIGYALGFAGLSLCSSIALSITFDNLRRLGVVIRSVLMMAIYEQALKLTTAARLSNTIGQTTNLMAIDAEKLNLAVQFLHFLWHGPLLALVICIVFIVEIGPAPALSGMAVLCIIFPMQNMVARSIGRIRQKMVKLTDERVKLINEMLQSIRVIKLYAWEDPLEKRVAAVRQQETQTLMKYLTAAGQLRELIFSVQPVVALIIFCVATYGVRQPLSLPQIFQVIAFLNITRFPLNLLGQAMKNVSDALVSIERLNRFFLLPTLKNTKGRQLSENPRVLTVNADFSWQDVSAVSTPSSKRSNSLLGKQKQDQIKTKEVELVVTTDSGKVPANQHSGPRGDIESQEEVSASPSPSDYFKLSNLNFQTNHDRELIAIIGPVGSGKSSFMSALLGEMILQTGKASIDGTLSFCAQTPWIQNITLKQNVLFKVDIEHVSEEMNQLYHAAIEAAALAPDIKILPAGDMTEIGERGINLSGGQKARVSIARAFFTSYYSQICLFDDPFSAVDGNTGNQIFQKGILQLLQNKLRIIALNSHMHLLKYFDRVIVLQQGKVFADGSLPALFAQYPGEMTKITGLSVNDVIGAGDRDRDPDASANDRASGLVKTLSLSTLSSISFSTTGNPITTTTTTGSTGNLRQQTSEIVTFKTKEEEKKGHSESKALSSFAGKTASGKEKKLISEEKADAGITTIVAYVKYFSASLTSARKITREPFYCIAATKSVFSYSLLVKGSVALTGLITIFSISQLVRVFVDIYLAKYVQHYLDGVDPTLYKDLYFGCFGIFIFSLLIRSGYLNYYSVRSSQVLHANLLRRILSAPIPTFFDTHTIGAILNRFSKDIETVDVNIPEFMLQLIINWFQLFSIFALCIWAAYWFAIIMVPLGIGYIRVYEYFSCASKSLKQLEAVSRSPIYSSLSETLYGLETIRAYGDTDRFMKDFEKRLKRNHKLMYHSFVVASWMTIRLELSTSLILLAVAVMAVTIRDIVSPISLGLALSYGLQLTALFQRCIQLLIEMTNYMHSTERVLEYLEKPQEIDCFDKTNNNNDHLQEPSSSKMIVRSRKSSASDVDERLKHWPKTGDIELINVWMQYRDNPPILKAVSVKIKGGQRIGVCGRTGAGKSSVMMALFRIVEITEGSICIDGIDVATIPLTTLRSHLAIIPQDPVLFTGDVRFQLDPFQQYSEAQIWEALQQVNLSDMVNSLPGGLHEQIAENGENLSQGQRQLLCIARALLRKAKILIVDEGTSAVDPHTDALIQTVLRKEAYENGTTVLAIAHRLQTIIDFDRILVLGHGQLLEYDSPANLLANENSTFSLMLKEATMS